MNNEEKEVPYHLPRHLARGPLAWMACNPVSANLLMFILLVGGLIMASRVTKDVFPEFSFDQISIRLVYPGATPEEMEKSIVLAIEQSLESVDGIKDNSAYISSGAATIYLDLEDGVDDNVVLQDVKAEVDRITTFPREAETPIIALAEGKVEVATLILSGNDNMHILHYWAEIIRDALTESSDVARVDLEGVRDMEVHVEIPQDTLRRYGLKLDDVAFAISNNALEQGGGTLKSAAGDIMMRMDERRDYASEFTNIPIRTNFDGSQLLLDDIAQITEGFQDVKTWAEFNGEKTILLAVYKNDSKDPGTVMESVMEVVDYYNAVLPGNLQVSIRNNLAQVYEDRETLLVSNAILGVVLVFICLALFLRPSLAFWVSLGIPVSVLGSFWFFMPFDLTINMISMFAFIVTLGIVVDDAIVVGENVSAWQEKGVHPLEAAIRGVKEVGGPVVFSVLTNIITFLPILFVPGVMGKVWISLPLVVIAVFICSLLESLFVLPAHLAHSPPPKKIDHTKKIPFFRHPLQYIEQKQDAFSIGFVYFSEYRFGALLNIVLRNKYISIAISIGVLILALAYVKSGRLGFDLMPRTESTYSYAEAMLPAGSPLSEIHRIRDHMVEKAEEIVAENGGETLSRGIYVLVKENSIVVRVFLEEADLRPIGTIQFTNLWREAVGTIPGVEYVLMVADRGGPGSGKSITARLSHRNTAVLNQAAEDLGMILSGYSGIGDVETGISKTKRQFDLKILPVAEQLGFTARDIALQVRAAFEGVIALRQQRGNNEVTVRVRLPEEDRNRLATFENLILRSPSGREVLLRDAVNVNDTQADSVIRHVNGRRTATVSANITPSSATGRMMETVENEIMPEFIANYPGLSWEFGGRQEDMRDTTSIMITGLLLALLGVYTLLAIPFKSYSQPIIIMLAIPFGIVGAIIGHLVMGYSLSVISIFGIVALSGVVVNDSLVLIDFANRRKREGADTFNAIRQAAIQRFRPILLTTLTTFVGLMPIIFETSRQARMMIPVALSLGFGILFATVICLLIVPSFYLALEDVKAFLSKKVVQVKKILAE